MLRSLAVKLTLAFLLVGLTGSILVTVIITGFVFIFPGDSAAVANSFPGPSIGMSRLELANSAIKLMGDFPITHIETQER